MRARRFWAALGSFALVAGLAAPANAVDTLPVPSTMAALGDSITVAYDATRLLTPQPEYSWSAGTSTSVQSLYLRLKKKNRKLVAANYAVSGAQMSDLAGQAGRVPAGTAKGKELVTILMGANDACTDTVASMTSVEDFSQHFSDALTVLTSRKVDHVVVASIPDVYQLWEDWHTTWAARFIWGYAGICQSLLADPLSDSAEPRRVQVQDRVRAFNEVLATKCLALSGATTCTYDGGAVFATDFLKEDVSTVDYFHPSVAGQAKLAEVTYRAFRFPLP